MDDSHPRWQWPVAQVGLCLTVFAVLALSGPGRIDIIDGQARYEVSRSLVEHGDVVVRDPDIWYPVMPGRDGQLFTNYRLPHSLLGVPAILLADATGPTREARRHFFFALINAIAGAACAVAYASWFAGHGASPRAAIGWAALGVLATPLWYYGTSTFDDALGTAFVLGALAAAWQSRRHGSLGWAAAAGLMIGIAVNCKQPLGLFVLPLWAAAFGPGGTDHHRKTRQLLILAGLALGCVTYLAYERYKFPPGTIWPTLKYAPPTWHTELLAAALTLIVSPAAGSVWYCPAVFVAAAGYVAWCRDDARFATAVLLACTGFFGFVCCLGFFKGDIGWGPRYLTPVLAVLWLFVPAGVVRIGRARATALLAVSVLVQVLSLGHDPHRLYIRNGYPPIINIAYPWRHFDLRSGHLFYRPTEIAEALLATNTPERFSPAPSPTFALPVPEDMVRAPETLTNSQVFAALRPWWACQWFLPLDERPVDLPVTLAGFVGLAAIGAGLTAAGLRQAGRVA